MYMQYHHFPAVINLHCKCWSSNMWHPISINFPIYLFAVEPTLLKVWYYISTKCDSFGSSMETLCQIWHLVPKKTQPIYDNFPIPGWHMHIFWGRRAPFSWLYACVPCGYPCCLLRWRLQREWISLPKVQVLHGSASRTAKQGAHVHNLSSRKNNDT